MDSKSPLGVHEWPALQPHNHQLWAPREQVGEASTWEPPRDHPPAHRAHGARPQAAWLPTAPAAFHCRFKNPTAKISLSLPGGPTSLSP